MPEGPGYCRRCGSPLPADATFCPKCGTPVAATSPPGGSWSTGPAWREKGEKGEKREKNEKEEKGGRGSLLGAAVGGLILIWLGVSFYLEENGYLPGDI